MIIYRLKSKKIIYDLYLPERGNGKVILYVPGLPGHPRRKDLGENFATNGFTFFEMRYPGSWESGGTFTMDNCVKSLEEAFLFIRGGVGIELRRGVKINWEHNNIIFLGSSFGGGVILSCKIKDSLTFVLLAPLTKLKNLRDSMFRLSSGEDDLYHLLSLGYANAYRGLSKSDWCNFINGKTLVNPENNIDNLKNKRIIFFQGTNDTVIMSSHTDEYVEELKLKNLNVELVTVTGAGHGGDLESKIASHLITIV